MKTVQERTKTRLNEKLNTLLKKLDKPFKEIKDLDILCEEIRKLEEELKDLNKRNRLKYVNKQHDEKRAILKDALNLQFPEDDITTQDGYFHATKVKKYPSIVTFMERYKYARFIFEKGKYTALNLAGNRYTLLKPCYSRSETKHEKFETTEEAMEFNGILLKPMTFAKFKGLEAKILKESERIRKENEKSYEKIKALNSYFLEKENLINSSQRSRYEYRSI